MSVDLAVDDFRQRIYFDGALPNSKIPVRLERSRKNLSKLRQLYKHHHFGLDLYTVPTSVDWAAVMTRPFNPWADSPMLSAPFMVSAVKESLLRNRPSQVSMVNDEADRACAYEASLTGCHVLTVDTDLLVYNIGDAAVMWLNDVTLGGGHETSEPRRLHIPYIRPRSLAQKWGLPTFNLLAYERSQNPRQNLPWIIRSAQVSLNARNQQESDSFEAFAQIYKSSGDMVRAFTSKRAGLDPRLSEVAMQFSLSKKNMPSMYMNPLFEDPSRESAWSYGVLFRALAYSCLMQSERGQVKDQREFVMEHYRKGIKMGISVVLVPEIALYSAGLCKMIRQHETNVHQYLDTCYFWRSFALRHVQQEKEYRKKNLVSEDHILSLFGIFDERELVDWEIVHLHATIESVLYSLRMLKQALAVLLSDEAKTCAANLKKLAPMLKTLPEISDLHLTIAEIMQKTRLDCVGLVLGVQSLKPQKNRRAFLSPESELLVKITAY